MLSTLLRSLMVAILLSGCAHRGAMRVECQGPLRPINPPSTLRDAPVTVVPVTPESSKSDGTAP